jgi:hypothetical protein
MQSKCIDFWAAEQLPVVPAGCSRDQRSMIHHAHIIQGPDAPLSPVMSESRSICNSLLGFDSLWQQTIQFNVNRSGSHFRYAVRICVLSRALLRAAFAVLCNTLKFQIQ